MRFARNVPLIGNAFRRLTERDRWVLRMEPRIHKAPSDGGVDQLAITALETALWLQGDEWCAAHTLNATSNDHFGIANCNRVGGGGERL